jgi:predicted nucleotidyltransferase
MARIPSLVSSLLDDLTTQFREILGRNLVGIYLYGSLTQAAFDPERSDIDCIVVTERDLSNAEFRKIRGWLSRAAQSNRWTLRLQASFLIKGKVLTNNSRACLYQFGKLTRYRSDGNPIVWMNVLKSGKILYGPSPRSLVAPITPRILFRALERELGYLRDEIVEKPDSKWRDVPFYRAYAVLTLCRILYSRKKGTIVSKIRASDWAMRYLPNQWNGLIRQALDSDAGRRSAPVPLVRIRQFIRFADAQLRAIAAPD